MTDIAVPDPRRGATPADLLCIALDQGADLDRLEKLMALQMQWEANQAKKEYADAMAKFKAEAPTIIKDKQVAFKDTRYRHATIGHVVDVIVPALGKHGLFHTWSTKQGDEGQVMVTCTITHRLGHSESTAMRCMQDTSGSKNAIQSIGSAVTYLQRYTLLALTGLAAQDGDDDGVNTSPISEEFERIKAALLTAGSLDELPAIKQRITDASMPAADRQGLVAEYNRRRATLAPKAPV